MLNSVTLVGRLTSDPTTFGEGNAKFNLAFDNPRKEATGERGTSFISCISFKGISEVITKFCKKGSKIGIQGTIQEKTWLDKTGAKRSQFEVAVDQVELLDKKEAQEENVPLNASPVEDEIKPTQPAFDPYTGKPLKKTNK